MRISLSILLLLTTLVSHGQSDYKIKSISSKTKKVVKRIEKINKLMSSAVYSSGMQPKQWDNFEELKKLASKEELIELTNHPNGVVRSYSFWALTYNKDIDLFSIVKKHLSDTDTIETQFGCIGGQEMVGDFFIQIMTPQYIDLESEKMASKEIKELDSLLIYQPTKLWSRYNAINRAEPIESLYPKIRELVINENNESALITLAKYKKEQDIETIINFREETEKVEGGFYSAYLAMQQFPRIEYIPLLESNLKMTLDNTYYSTEWKALYGAIASLKNNKALELLKIPFTEVQHKDLKKYHMGFVFNAVMKFQDSIYDNLLWRLWEEEGQRNLKSYRYLLLQNPNKAYELVKKELIIGYQIEESDFISELEDAESSENLNELFLNTIIANEKELSNKIIKEQIENSDVHNLGLYTSKVKQQIFFIEPLFNRLEKSWNPHIYLILIETLIEFKDDKINKRILEVRKQNNKLNEDWGGRALNKLLAENGIE